MRVEADTCPKCHRIKGEKHKACTPQPSLKTLEKWSYDGIACATDGCRVELDGVCPHGHSSWLMVLGYI